MHLAFNVFEINQFRFGCPLSIWIKSVRLKVEKNAFTLKVQNHPKGVAKGKLKESASHHVKKFVFQKVNCSPLARFSRLCLTSGVLNQKL